MTAPAAHNAHQIDRHCGRMPQKVKTARHGAGPPERKRKEA